MKYYAKLKGWKGKKSPTHIIKWEPPPSCRPIHIVLYHLWKQKKPTKLFFRVHMCACKTLVWGLEGSWLLTRLPPGRGLGLRVVKEAVLLSVAHTFLYKYHMRACFTCAIRNEYVFLKSYSWKGWSALRCISLAHALVPRGSFRRRSARLSPTEHPGRRPPGILTPQESQKTLQLPF